MKKILLILILSLSCFSQVSRNFKKTQKPKYEIGFGAISLDVPNYPGAANNTPRIIPFPWIIYRGDFIQADEEGTRAKLIVGKDLEVGLSAGFNFPIDSNENRAREGMPDTEALFGFGPGLIYRFFKDDPLQRLNLRLGIRVNYSSDFGSNTKYQGFLIEPSIRYWRKLSEDGNVTIFSGLSTSYSDQEYADFFYTVKKEFETSAREEFKAQSGLIDIAASLGISYDFSAKGSFFTGAFYSNLTRAANKESPLVEEQHNLGLIIGFAWLFFESETMVK